MNTIQGNDEDRVDPEQIFFAGIFHEYILRSDSQNAAGYDEHSRRVVWPTAVRVARTPPFRLFVRRDRKQETQAFDLRIVANMNGFLMATCAR